MANPTITSRTIPTKQMIHEGFKTVIAFSLNAAIEFWEKEITPVGYDGGEGVDQTTMLNTSWHTKFPRTLINIPDITVNAAWSAHLYTDILALINKQGSCTITFPNGDTLAFYAYISSFIPGQVTEGAMPMANIKIVVTNLDPVNLVEVGPLFTAATGTG